jgi:ornithine cyclodeaminase/alanine dehydrogenase-like protein (mu-crystallin family)
VTLSDGTKAESKARFSARETKPGMALQDVAAAAFLYEKAERDGSGVWLDLAA